MFWRTQAPAAESDIDQLLNKPVINRIVILLCYETNWLKQNQQDVKLTELMDSEYLLQEVKVSNKKLIAL